MLQFWKKSGQKEKGTRERSASSSPAKSSKSPSSPALSNGDVSLGFDPCPIGPLSGFQDEELTVGDLGESDGSPAHGRKVFTRSRLSKTLLEVLTDKGALGYFIQFLEAQDAIALIKFWLDVESFRAASCARIRNDASGRTVAVPITREQLDGISDNISHCTSPLHDQDKLSLGTDCESTTADSTSIFESPLHSIHVSSKESLLEEKNANSKTPDQSLTNVSLHPKEYVSNFKICEKTHSKSECNCVNTVDEQASGLTSYKCTDTDYKTDSRTGSCCDKTTILPRIKVGSVSECSFSFRDPLTGRLGEDQVSDRSSVSSGRDEQPLSPTRANKLIQATLDDAVRIFKKYIAHGAQYPLRISDGVRSRMVAAICKEDGLVDAECFTESQVLVFHIMEKDYFNHFLRSDYHCKHQIDVLTSGNVLLADILYNETALFYFMEYMEQEGNQSLVEFWLAAINFQQHLVDKKGNYDGTEAQNDAIVLYDKYFSLQATCPLGFSDKIRVDVEHNICREEGPLPDCFRRAVNIVLHVLEKNYLQPFLTSQLYFKYLSELINTIQASPALMTRNRKTGSECSSELNISIQNTLLAMEDSAPPPRKIIRNIDDREMCIDSRQLYDPDSLWRRRHQSGLCFGRINKLGRFETDVEPEPDKKEESRITKVVKKLVNMEEDKAKEEMAWQIAEMIVKDITNLTMGSDNEVQS